MTIIDDNQQNRDVGTLIAHVMYMLSELLKQIPVDVKTEIYLAIPDNVKLELVNTLHFFDAVAHWIVRIYQEVYE